MILKDKLEKTGHHRPYHTLRKLMLSFFLVTGIFAAGAIPVGLSYQAGVEAAAERSSYSEIEDEPTSSESSYVIEEN